MTTPVPPLLTDEEHDLMRLLGDVANGFHAITGFDRTRNADLTEAVAHIHALQHMVMAQAAARAYADTYRLMGEVIPPLIVRPPMRKPRGR